MSKSTRSLIINSSDNIVWEGEDLPCIKLCKGDTVSDVTYKLAIEICVLKRAYDLKDIDLKAVFQACIACPQPIKTLQNVLQLIINKVTSLDQILKTIGVGSSSAVSVDITLASCFLPKVNLEGDPITKLPHADYTRLIATTVCSLVGSVNGYSGRLDLVEEEIESLINQVGQLGIEPKVSPVCVTPTNTPILLSDAWVLLEGQFCQIKKAVGESPALLAAVSKQPTGLKDEIQLGSNSTMSTLSGWKSIIETVADAINNQWLTILDMRGAIKAIQDNCCKINCDSIIIDFGIKMDDTRTQVSLFFAAKTKVPIGFTDCSPNGNKLTISDSAGNSTDVLIKVSTVSTYSIVDGIMTETPVVIDLTNTSLDPKLDYTFNMEACITNGDLTCQKCITKSATYKDTCSYCEISVAASTDVTGSLTIAYID